MNGNGKRMIVPSQARGKEGKEVCGCGRMNGRVRNTKSRSRRSKVPEAKPFGEAKSGNARNTSGPCVCPEERHQMATVANGCENEQYFLESVLGHCSPGL